MRSGMKPQLLVILICSSAGFVAIWLLFSQLRSMRADAVRATKDLASLKENIRAVAAERAQPTVIYQAPRAEREMDIAPAVSAPALAPAEPPAGLSAEEKHYRLGVINQAQAELIGSTWEHEPPDPAWSSKATQLLTSAYQGEDFSGIGISATCKSTICKVNVASTDVMQGEKALHKMIEKQPWPSYGFGHFDREKQEGFVYLAREGTDLPRVDVATLTF